MNFLKINIQDLPIEIKAGEELVLLIKIIKNTKEFDKIFHNKEIKISANNSVNLIESTKENIAKRKNSEKNNLNRNYFNTDSNTK